MASGKKRVEGEWIAEFLVNYLNTEDPDPYDFGHLLQGWARTARVAGVDNETSAGDLEERDLKAFAKWLKVGEGRDVVERCRPPELTPSYVMMGDARRLPAGSWLLHYTASDPFTSFDRGALLDAPLWLTHTGNRNTPRIKCPGNLSENISEHEVAFGFAHEVGKEPRRFAVYGHNAVLFKCDIAVVAYHHSDEEWQAIFPICSEYDAIGIYGANGRGGGLVNTVDGEGEFEGALDIIEAFKRGSIGLARGSSQKNRSRWHPLSQPKKRGTRGK